MRITELRTFQMWGEPRNWVFVKLTTDEGSHGWGEGTTEGREETVRTAIHEVGKYLIGKDPTAVKTGAWAGDTGLPKARAIAAFAARVEKLRETVGPDVEIMIDNHGRSRPSTAVRLMQALQPYRLYWFEEPTQPDFGRETGSRSPQRHRVHREDAEKRIIEIFVKLCVPGVSVVKTFLSHPQADIRSGP